MSIKDISYIFFYKIKNNIEVENENILCFKKKKRENEKIFFSKKKNTRGDHMIHMVDVKWCHRLTIRFDIRD